MSVGNDMNSTHDAIREEAAAWFARRRDGARTRREEDAFEAWCSRSDVHVRAYAETERAWEQWKSLRDSPRMRAMSAAAIKATAPRRRATGRHWRPLLAAASLAAMAVLGGIWLLPLTKHMPPVTYSTGLGEQRTEQLPDGTRIVLNTQTVLQVHYDHRQRRVTLQHGEALFEVAHDAGYPFVVTTAGGSITDLGTRFQVRDKNGMAIVTLLQGEVEVATQDKRRPLVPGEQARYGVGISGIRVRQVDPSTVTSWVHGRLNFNGMPLAQAIAEANRYSEVKLRLGDPRLADLPVGGSFHAGNNTAIAAALSAVFPVRVAHRDAHEIVLVPR